MSAVLTREEFEDWLQHPVTQEVKQVLKSEREVMKEGVLNSIYTDEAAVKGMCLAMQRFIDLEYEDLFND